MNKYNLDFEIGDRIYSPCKKEIAPNMYLFYIAKPAIEEIHITKTDVIYICYSSAFHKVNEKLITIPELTVHNAKKEVFKTEEEAIYAINLMKSKIKEIK